MIDSVLLDGFKEFARSYYVGKVGNVGLVACTTTVACWWIDSIIEVMAVF